MDGQAQMMHRPPGDPAFHNEYHYPAQYYGHHLNGGSGDASLTSFSSSSLQRLGGVALEAVGSGTSPAAAVTPECNSSGGALIVQSNANTSPSSSTSAGT
ncbi:hypothetical protein B566_EDAN001613 [Ephemera danica]|nr:hypothetical protein B566_EDAN001613 [Ephemera danica]